MEREEFSALAEKYMDLVWRVALNCVGHPADADDVTQNVMLRAFRSAPGLAGEEHARRWLIRVTVNESRRLLTAPGGGVPSPLRSWKLSSPLQTRASRGSCSPASSLCPPNTGCPSTSTTTRTALWRRWGG